MVRNRLVVDYTYDFELFGIISHLKEYRLAWLLNNQLKIHLVKQNDIIHEFIDAETIYVSNYLYETENTQLRLLRNKSENKNSEKSAFLLPELHKFDFFIMKNGVIDGKDDLGFLVKLKEIEEIQYVTSFNISKLKSRENLIF